MFDRLKILNSMSAMAQHAQKRHSIIAHNIANADTPGFTAQDIKPFSEVFAQTGHKDLKTAINNLTPFAQSNFDATAPNGNSVSLEEQSIKAVEAKMDHEMAIMIYRKTMDLIKLASSKNV